MAIQLEVTLTRDSLESRWGFKLVGGKDCSKPLQVEIVYSGNAADGVLKVGDIIVGINGHPTDRMKHYDAIDLISSFGSSLTLQVERFGHQSVVPKGQVKFWPRTNEADRSASFKDPTTTETLRYDSDGSHSTRVDPMSRYGRTWSSLPTPERMDMSDKDLTLYLPKRPHTTQIYHHRPTGSRSGSSTPTVATSPVVEMKSPTSTSGPAMAIWTPPTDRPTSRLVHMQYNSPLDLYTTQNVADMVEKTTGRPLQWTHPPKHTEYYDDIHQSPTCRLLEELEGRRSVKQHHQPQSSVMKRLGRNLDAPTF